MPDLKLAKLPDRTLVKITISVTPDLKHALDDYASVYRQIYGVDEAVGDLVPHMLEAFIAADRTFVKARAFLPETEHDAR